MLEESEKQFFLNSSKKNLDIDFFQEKIVFFWKNSKNQKFSIEFL